jgi:hypothetical protein
VLSRSLAWFFILLAACPFTAPFAACDLSQALSNDAYAVDALASSVVAAGFVSTRQTVGDAGVTDEQIKDVDDLLNIAVVKAVVIEFGSSTAAYSTPPIRQHRPARFQLVALRL